MNSRTIQQLFSQNPPEPPLSGPDFQALQIRWLAACEKLTKAIVRIHRLPPVMQARFDEIRNMEATIQSMKLEIASVRYCKSICCLIGLTLAGTAICSGLTSTLFGIMDCCTNSICVPTALEGAEIGAELGATVSSSLGFYFCCFNICNPSPAEKELEKIQAIVQASLAEFQSIESDIRRMQQQVRALEQKMPAVEMQQVAPEEPPFLTSVEETQEVSNAPFVAMEESAQTTSPEQKNVFSPGFLRAMPSTPVVYDNKSLQNLRQPLLP